MQAVAAETLPAWLASEATGQLGLTEFSFSGGGETTGKAGFGGEWRNIGFRI